MGEQGGVEYADRFEEAYQGEWDSERDFAEELADDLGALRDTSGFVASYFDYDAFARDLFLSDYSSVPAGGGRVYVFSNHV